MSLTINSQAPTSPPRTPKRRSISMSRCRRRTRRATFTVRTGRGRHTILLVPVNKFLTSLFGIVVPQPAQT